MGSLLETYIDVNFVWDVSFFLPLKPELIVFGPSEPASRKESDKEKEEEKERIIRGLFQR